MESRYKILEMQSRNLLKSIPGNQRQAHGDPYLESGYGGALYGDALYGGGSYGGSSYGASSYDCQVSHIRERPATLHDALREAAKLNFTQEQTDSTRRQWEKHGITLETEKNAGIR